MANYSVSLLNRLDEVLRCCGVLGLGMGCLLMVGGSRR